MTVSDWLREQRANPEVTGQVDELIKVHEFGGWPEADLVQAADSLSFLDVNVDLFPGFVRTGHFTADQVQAKFEYSHNRIRIPWVRARRVRRWCVNSKFIFPPPV